MRYFKGTNWKVLAQDVKDQLQQTNITIDRGRRAGNCSQSENHCGHGNNSLLSSILRRWVSRALGARKLGSPFSLVFLVNTHLCWLSATYSSHVLRTMTRKHHKLWLGDGVCLCHRTFSNFWLVLLCVRVNGVRWAIFTFSTTVKRNVVFFLTKIQYLRQDVVYPWK